MARYFEKLIAVIFVAFSISIVSCKKDHTEPIIEPIIEDGGEIVSSSKAKGKLDTGFITLSYSEGKVNGLVIYLESKKGTGPFSNIDIVYTNIPEDTKIIPEGEFTFSGTDFFHYSINNSEDFAGHQKDLKFSLKRISGIRYSIKFSGTTST